MELPEKLLKLVSPRAIRNYAAGLGWVEQTYGDTICTITAPNGRQIVVPLDSDLDDYSESLNSAILRLASFERRNAVEVLNHLLAPPADNIDFAEVGPDVEKGVISLEHGCRMLEGARLALMSIAHSIDAGPTRYHKRMSRERPKEFLSKCKMRTRAGSFVLNVSCEFEGMATLIGIDAIPFARRVTKGLLSTLQALETAASTNRGDHLLDDRETPGISANFCEAILLLRPNAESSQLEVSAQWSRTLAEQAPTKVTVSPQVFDIAEQLIPQLKTHGEPVTQRFFAYVDELRGDPDPTELWPRGDVRLLLFDDDKSKLTAKAELSLHDYSTACTAHMRSSLVTFMGTLRRQPRLCVIDDITQFEIVTVPRQQNILATE